MDRPIFIDQVLGLEIASMRQIVDIVKRTYCGTFALQYMHISNPEQAGWLKERIEGYGKEIAVHPRGPQGDPEQAGRGRGLREVPACQIHGHQALRPGRRRKPDPGDGTDHQARRRAGREGSRHRHAAPRPAERAGERDAEALPRDLQRIPGRQLQARGCRGLGRRQIPPRRLVGPHLRQQHRAPVADRQPQPSGSGEPGGAGQGAGQAVPVERRRPHRGAADPAAWRRRLRRPGHHRRMLRPVGPGRPPHRRHHPYRRQQPDRLHHRAALFALVALSDRHRADGRGADLPRQRRRPRSGGPCRQGRHRVPAEVPQGRGDRHLLLSPVRP